MYFAFQQTKLQLQTNENSSTYSSRTDSQKIMLGENKL